jgi:hypothetical protein
MTYVHVWMCVLQVLKKTNCFFYDVFASVFSLLFRRHARTRSDTHSLTHSLSSLHSYTWFIRSFLSTALTIRRAVSGAAATTLPFPITALHCTLWATEQCAPRSPHSLTPLTHSLTHSFNRLLPDYDAARSDETELGLRAGGVAHLGAGGRDVGHGECGPLTHTLTHSLTYSLHVCSSLS